MNDHLSTSGSSDVRELLQSSDDCNLLIVVSICTRDGLNSRLDEKNRWVHGFWKLFSAEFSHFIGCRTSWDNILFCVPSIDLDPIIIRLRRLLTASHDQEIESRCLVKRSTGDIDSKFNDVVEMHDEVLSWLKQSKSTGEIDVRLVDGIVCR